MFNGLKIAVGDLPGFLSTLLALETTGTANYTIPTETTPALDLGPFGKFEVVLPAISLTFKKVG